MEDIVGGAGGSPEGEGKRGLFDAVWGAETVTPTSEVAREGEEACIEWFKTPEAGQGAPPRFAWASTPLEESDVCAGAVKGAGKVFSPAFHSAADVPETAAGNGDAWAGVALRPGEGPVALADSVEALLAFTSSFIPVRLMGRSRPGIGQTGVSVAAALQESAGKFQRVKAGADKLP
jgi:hypothetical protein